MDAKAKDINFSNCNVYEVAMLDADLENANFSNSNIELFDVQSAPLKGANFSNSNLSGLNLGRCDLTEVDSSNLVIIRKIILKDTKLDGTSFKKLTFKDNPKIIVGDTIYEGKSLPIE